ncbi:hypothetical protein ACH9L7_20375 (plasmid) [Haloferax sp. S1W]|uniref:hypothetical protein n=1 Tax=Haloferax sp. S1W TaxID=3377110 RepID=UPI0037C831DF
MVLTTNGYSIKVSKDLRVFAYLGNLEVSAYFRKLGYCEYLGYCELSNNMGSAKTKEPVFEPLEKQSKTAVSDDVSGIS